jgi:hypothetical protein
MATNVQARKMIAPSGPMAEWQSSHVQIEVPLLLVHHRDHLSAPT